MEFVAGGFWKHGFREYWTAHYGMQDGSRHRAVIATSSDPKELCVERFGAEPSWLRKVSLARKKHEMEP